MKEMRDGVGMGMRSWVYKLGIGGDGDGDGGGGVKSAALHFYSLSYFMSRAQIFLQLDLLMGVVFEDVLLC